MACTPRSSVLALAEIDEAERKKREQESLEVMRRYFEEPMPGDRRCSERRQDSDDPVSSDVRLTAVVRPAPSSVGVTCSVAGNRSTPPYRTRREGSTSADARYAERFSVPGRSSTPLSSVSNAPTSAAGSPVSWAALRSAANSRARESDRPRTTTGAVNTPSATLPNRTSPQTETETPA